jgi:hypothetical protein
VSHLVSNRFPKFSALVLVPGIVASIACGASAPAPVIPPSLGTNLSEVADYSRELPFVDVFKTARTWISQQSGKPWGQGPALKLDANGWITSLLPGQYAETIMLDNALEDMPHYPSGDYILLYDGQGTIAFDNQTATIVSQTPGRMVVHVPANENGIFLKVTATTPSNHLRNIRFIMPGYETTYQANPFYPGFLSKLSGFRALRFMEWMRTNGSTVKNWADRALPGDYTYTLRGVPLEVMIDLANRLRLTPWFNIPAMATDAYVKSFAALVQKDLDPTLRFYVEYSNETWNGSFSQNAYMQTQGVALKLDPNSYLAGAYYTSLRATQVFAQFDKSRAIRVLAAQAANWWLSDQMLGFKNAAANVDALAIAPYFNCDDTGAGGFGMLGDPATAAQVDKMTVDQIVDIELQHINGCAMQQMMGNAAVAKKYKIPMVAYEGGQSLVGFGSAQNDTVMAGLFEAANRSPRMTSLYTTYLNNWVAAGGTLFNHFTDVTGYTRFGSFGSLEYQDESPANSPKYQALIGFAAKHQ